MFNNLTISLEKLFLKCYNIKYRKGRDTLEILQLKTVSTVDAVCRALEDDIFFRFSPGEKITEATLNTRYGVSRNTIREAITYLISNGLLVKIANRGVFVRSITREDVREIFSLRALLEVEAIKRITEKETPTKQLLENAELLEKMNPYEHWNEYVSADMNFHSLLVSLSDSPRLCRLYGTISAEVMLCICQSKRHIPPTAINEISHKKILDAISRKDVTCATKLLSEHIESAILNYENGFDSE